MFSITAFNEGLYACPARCISSPSSTSPSWSHSPMTSPSSGGKCLRSSFFHGISFSLLSSSLPLLLSSRLDFSSSSSLVVRSASMFVSPSHHHQRHQNQSHQADTSERFSFALRMALRVLLFLRGLVSLKLPCCMARWRGGPFDHSPCHS